MIMKKLTALLLVLALACLSLVAFAEDAVYTATYNITDDYMDEDEDTGALTVAAFPETPLGESGPAVGYAGSFGAFVDAVSVDVSLELTGDTYVYTLKVHCGTEACARGNYSPEYTWSGKVEAADEASVTVAAPEHATILIEAEGQFATNEEQVGYFGAVGYTADETTDDCPYPAVPSGEVLLNMFSAGTFAVSDGEIIGFTMAE